MSVITCWGTQFGLLQSVLNNREALRHFVLDSRQGLKLAVHQLLLDPAFWLELETA